MALRPDDGTLDILSICTGGGGLDLGVQLALEGARSVCLVEREAFAVAHLVSAMEQGLLHPAPVWSDARTFDGGAWRGCVDGLIGGIPCQPHSLAGRKQGQLDERDLWTDARRIIVQARCWFVLIENVGGMLAAGADEIAGAERVWRDLRKLGFKVEAGLFTAAECGAPHQRERLFILGVADPGGERRPEITRSASGNEGENAGRPAPHDNISERAGANLADAGDPRLQGGERPGALGERDGKASPRSAAELRGTRLGHAPGEGSHAAPHAGTDFGDEGTGPRHAQSERRGGSVANADFTELRREPSARQFEVERDASPRLFPPGPRDFDAWRIIAERRSDLIPAHAGHDRFRIEIGNALASAHGDPAKRAWLDAAGPFGLRAAVVQEIAERTLRGMADGLAANRIDWLRLLGNGVVPLAAAHAFRTLATRLAASGSTSAARLVRMMEAAE